MIIRILTLVNIALSPIILASAYFIQNIQHSKCCGNSKIEMKQNSTLIANIVQLKEIKFKPRTARKKSNVNKIIEEIIKRKLIKFD